MLTQITINLTPGDSARTQMVKKKKDWGENSKKEEARTRKNAAKAEERSRSAKNAEDAYWREAGDGQKTRAQQKREEAEEKRREAAAKKLELKRLAEEEQKKLDASSKKTQRERVPVPKVINRVESPDKCFFIHAVVPNASPLTADHSASTEEHARG